MNLISKGVVLFIFPCRLSEHASKLRELVPEQLRSHANALTTERLCREVRGRVRSAARTQTISETSPSEKKEDIL